MRRTTATTGGTVSGWQGSTGPYVSGGLTTGPLSGLADLAFSQDTGQARQTVNSGLANLQGPDRTALASEAKSILGPATKISYSADWTEYGAHVPKEGELRFPLDLLWSSRDVDFVGVDVYWPLSDWRDGGDCGGD